MANKEAQLLDTYGCEFVELSDFRWIVPLPFIFDPFQPFNFTRPPINAVAVDYRTRFRIAAAFGVVVFTKNKLKVSVSRLFSAVADTIQRDSVRIDTVVFESPLEYGQGGVLIKRMRSGTSVDDDW